MILDYLMGENGENIGKNNGTDPVICISRCKRGDIMSWPPSVTQLARTTSFPRCG